MDEQTTCQPPDEPTGGDPPCWQHLVDEAGRLDSADVRAADVERMRRYLPGPSEAPPQESAAE